MTLARQFRTSSARTRGAMRWLVFLVALAIAPALALAQPKGNPRLASLAIEIWPEYDRASAALVILKGELAADVKLPAKVALRLPKAAGGPSAVAFFRAPGSGALNLAHDVEETAEATVVRFEAPERVFLVEFYEPFSTALPARSYTYTWPGDLAAERVTVVVQEPATSSGLEVEPKLERSATGNDGLRYVSADLGAQAAGKALPIALRYSKPDMRTSVDIVKPKGDATAPAAATPSAPSPASGAASGNVPIPGSVIALLAIAAAAIGAALLFFWWKMRATPPAKLAHGACTQCGAPRRPGDRFCGKCGAKL